MRLLRSTGLIVVLCTPLGCGPSESSGAEENSPPPTDAKSDAAKPDQAKPSLTADLPEGVTVLQDPQDIELARSRVQKILKRARSLESHRPGIKLVYQLESAGGANKELTSRFGRLDVQHALYSESISQSELAEWSVFTGPHDYELGGDLDALARAQPSEIKADRFVSAQIELESGESLDCVGISVQGLEPARIFLLSEEVAGLGLVGLWHADQPVQMLKRIEKDQAELSAPDYITQALKLKQAGLQLADKLAQPGAWVALGSVTDGANPERVYRVTDRDGDVVSVTDHRADGSTLRFQIDLSNGRQRLLSDPEDAWPASFVRLTRVYQGVVHAQSHDALGECDIVELASSESVAKEGAFVSEARPLLYALPKQRDQELPFLLGFANIGYRNVVSFGSSLEEMPQALKSAFSIAE